MNALWRSSHLPRYLYRVMCKEVRPITSLCSTILGTKTEVQNLKPANITYSAIRYKSKTVNSVKRPTNIQFNS